MKNYEIINSPSELKIRVYGLELKDIFRVSLIAMFEACEPVYVEGATPVRHEITLVGPTAEILLVDFLSEALYYADAHHEAFFSVGFEELSEHSLRATIIGKKVLSFNTGIKAVTHHGVDIIEMNGQLSTDIVIDI